MSAFTDADVQLVTEALADDHWVTSPAVAILTALADAGRLTPPGAELRDRWQVQYLDKAFTERHAHFFDYRHDADLCVSEVAASERFSEIKVLHKISTAWVAADGTP